VNDTWTVMRGNAWTMPRGDFFLSEFISLLFHMSKQYRNYSHKYKVIWVELEE